MSNAPPPLKNLAFFKINTIRKKIKNIFKKCCIPFYLVHYKHVSSLLESCGVNVTNSLKSEIKQVSFILRLKQSTNTLIQPSQQTKSALKKLRLVQIVVSNNGTGSPVSRVRKPRIGEYVVVEDKLGNTYQGTVVSAKMVNGIFTLILENAQYNNYNGRMLNCEDCYKTIKLKNDTIEGNTVYKKPLSNIEKNFIRSALDIFIKFKPSSMSKTPIQNLSQLKNSSSLKDKRKNQLIAFTKKLVKRNKNGFTLTLKGQLVRLKIREGETVLLA